MSAEIMAQTKDVTVELSGDVFISQSKVAELCGVKRQVITAAIARKSSYVAGINLNQNNQIDHKSLVNVVTYFAKKNRPEAIDTLAKFAEAGAKFYLYSLAGYKFKAEKPPVVPLLTEDVKLAISTNTVERNTYVRHHELLVLVEQSILVRVKRTRTYWEYHLTEKGKALGYRVNKNGTILNPVGE